MEELLATKLSLESTLNIFMAILFNYALIELAYLYFVKKYDKINEYKQTTLNFVFTIVVNGIVSTLFGALGTGIFSIWAYQITPFQLGTVWYAWIYGWLVYELFYWVQHWLAHKVRFFWCLHSPHHAPESMNMFVGFNHSIFEIMFYMPFFLGFLPSLLGVHPAIVLTIVIVDVFWGNLLHINDSIVKGSYGFLEKIFQTPSYHRVHHAQNPRYMDTNYNSITLFWDWVFGTLQPLRDDEKVQYGITRDVRTTNFFDVQFGEYALLIKDMWEAPRWKDKFLYLIMPPGWSHTGDHKTADVLKREVVKN